MKQGMDAFVELLSPDKDRFRDPMNQHMCMIPCVPKWGRGAEGVGSVCWVTACNPLPVCVLKSWLNYMRAMLAHVSGSVIVHEDVHVIVLAAVNVIVHVAVCALLEEMDNTCNVLCVCACEYAHVSD